MKILKKEKIKKAIIFLSILIPLISVNFLMLLFAYTPPTEGPPGGNVPGFLNTGSETQVKEGALETGGVIEVLGLKVNPGSLEKPVCNSENEGVLWVEHGGVGEADEPFFCKKDFEGDFFWTQVGLSPSLGAIGDSCVLDADCGPSPYGDTNLICDSYDDTCRVPLTFSCGGGALSSLQCEKGSRGSLGCCETGVDTCFDLEGVATPPGFCNDN